MSYTIFTILYIIGMFVVLFILRSKQISLPLPNLMTVLGVLGTFIGIFIGLLGFDVTDIQGSVPRLLKGLRFAFLTSIVGMGLAVALRVIPALTGQRLVKSQGATLDHVVAVMEQGVQHQREVAEKSENRLEAIERALTGDGESTVLTQLQKLRTSMNDKQDELLGAFKTFAEQMAENNQRALIDALTEVMRDFNAKINEQFGDNFRQLNEAVGKMLDWQRQYGIHVEEMTTQLQRTIEAVDASRIALADIVVTSQRFESTAQALENVLQAIHRQTEELSDRLQAFAAMAEQARTAIPKISRTVEALTTDFSNAVRAAVDSTQATIREQQHSTAELIRQTQAGVNEQQSVLQQSQTALQQQLSDTLNGVTGRIERLMQQNAETITQQIEALDASLGEELNRSLHAMGTHLASLSQKFVDDYSPLTERLRDVLQIAERNRS